MTTDAAALRGNWNYPTSVKFGCGRIKELADRVGVLHRGRIAEDIDPAVLDHVALEQIYMERLST